MQAYRDYSDFFFILPHKIDKKQQQHTVITAKLPSYDVPRLIQCQNTLEVQSHICYTITSSQ